MGKITTPQIITEQIIELCKSISEYEPIYVPVNVSPQSRFNECFPNVAEYVREYGGQSVLGRCIWQRANVLIEAEAHAVWKSPNGDLLDITPHINDEKSILFLKDPQMVYEGYIIPSIRKGLTPSPLVAEFISLFNERDQLAAEAKDGTYTLTTAMLKMMHEIEALLNQKVGRNDSCPCQSGIKYKKCCGQYKA